jgi:hypothetical protein
VSLDGKREAGALEPFRQIHPTPPFPRSLLRDRSCSFFSLTSPTLPSALAQLPSCTMSSPDVKPLPFVYQFAAGESQCLRNIPSLRSHDSSRSCARSTYPARPASNDASMLYSVSVVANRVQVPWLVCQK